MTMHVLPVSVEDFHPLIERIPELWLTTIGEQKMFTGSIPRCGDITLFQIGTSEMGVIVANKQTISKLKTTSRVSERALIARINRKLRKENEFLVLKKTRHNSRWINDLGDYYLVDELQNTIEAQHIDLKDFACEMGVLAFYEELAM